MICATRGNKQLANVVIISPGSAVRGKMIAFPFRQTESFLDLIAIPIPKKGSDGTTVMTAPQTRQQTLLPGVASGC